ncbi:2OG-Fe(II) oxygenase [Mycena latifolia]|nr:2OG-Fe(II) oxygenase [Mycena latifolia]
MHEPSPTEVPIIDLASEDQDIVVKQIRRACETVGLFYVENHGIPEEVLQQGLATSAEFFSLDDEAKMRLYQEDPISLNLGYRPSRDSKVDPYGTEDLMEGFTVQWDPPDDSATRNKWPAEVPALRDVVLHYYSHALDLGRLLYRLLSRAMGLAEDFFEDKAYPTRTVAPAAPTCSRFVVPATSHRPSSFGTFTILLQQPAIEALQIVAPNIGWTFIPPIPGTLIVKLGDQTAICTNGVFRSPLHRVVCRPGADRYSIPLFFFADLDVVLEVQSSTVVLSREFNPLQPHESFVTAERPRKYGAMTAGERFEKSVAAALQKKSESSLDTPM